MPTKVLLFLKLSNFKQQYFNLFLLCAVVGQISCQTKAFYPLSLRLSGIGKQRASVTFTAEISAYAGRGNHLLEGNALSIFLIFYFLEYEIFAFLLPGLFCPARHGLPKHRPGKNLV